MLKQPASGVLDSSKSSTGTRPPHHSAARTDLVLLIRRTVRPRGYASGFDSPPALLDSLFEHPVGRSQFPQAYSDWISDGAALFFRSLLIRSPALAKPPSTP